MTFLSFKHPSPFTLWSLFHSLEYFLNSFSLTTNNLFEPGDQVYISYGKRSNDELLQYYGFVSCLPGGTARGGRD